MPWGEERDTTDRDLMNARREVDAKDAQLLREKAQSHAYRHALQRAREEAARALEAGRAVNPLWLRDLVERVLDSPVEPVPRGFLGC